MATFALGGWLALPGFLSYTGSDSLLIRPAVPTHCTAHLRKYLPSYLKRGRVGCALAIEEEEEEEGLGDTQSPLPSFLPSSPFHPGAKVSLQWTWTPTPRPRPTANREQTDHGVSERCLSH